MFDLPVDTKAARRAYADFRSLLLSNGFEMLQFSVYARYCRSEDVAETHRRRIKGDLPDDGEIRVLGITDKQFGAMQIFLGKMRRPPEREPRQLEFF
jgi:CRISPR-associated protein Cas2